MSRRIAYICSRYPVLREAFISREVLALERAGLDVCVYTLKAPERGLRSRDLDESKAVPYYSPHFFSWRVLRDNVLTFLRAPVRYVGFPLQWAWIFRRYPLQAAKCIGLFPKMVHYARHMKENGVRGANSCWASLPTQVALVARTFYAVPYSMTCRAWDIFVPMNQLGLDRKIGAANVVRANNDAGAAFVRRFCRSPADEAKIRRVYNPYDVESIEPRREPPAGRFVITSGGSLVEQKGLTYLLDAVAALRQNGIDCEVQLVGEGPLRGPLQDRARRLRHRGTLVRRQPAESCVREVARSQAACADPG